MTTTLVPYLNFDGNTAEAMEFYRSILGGDLYQQTFAEAGMAKDPAMANRVMHASLTSGSIVIMASDNPGTGPFVPGNNVHLSLNGEAADEAELRIAFDRLAAGGTLTMPLARQFWGDTFGMLTDRFGIHWMMNISKA